MRRGTGLLGADLQESSETDEGSEAGTGEGGDLASTGGRDLLARATGGGSNGLAGVAALTTVGAGRVDGDEGGVAAAVDGLTGLAGVTGLASLVGRGRAVVADNSGGGQDGLGDGARAVSDGQGGGLSDGVGLVAVNDLSRTGAVGGVSSNDLGGVGDVLGVGSDAGSESESSNELHVDGFGGFWELD